MRAVVVTRAGLIFLPIAVIALILLTLVAPDDALRSDLALVWAAGLALFAAGSWLLASLWQGRRDFERTIRTNESRFRTLLNSAPDAVLIADNDGRILLANAETERLFGYSRDELLGGTIEMLVPERARPKHSGLRAQYAAAPRTRTMAAGIALTARRKDGSRFAARNAADLPQVVLLDLKLPKVDGIEVLRQVRGDPRTRMLPIDLLTSSKEERELSECYRLGCNSYVRGGLRSIRRCRAAARILLAAAQRAAAGVSAGRGKARFA